MTVNKIWTKDEIRKLLETNDKMVVRSLLKLYQRQEIDEINSKETIHSNGIGFNAYDAPYLTAIAKYYLKTNRIYISDLKRVRKKLIKYSGQLTKIANKEM